MNKLDINVAETANHLLLQEPRYFQPHLEEHDGLSDPDNIAVDADSAFIQQNCLFGAVETIISKYTTAEQWGDDEGLDYDIGCEFDEYYKQAHEQLCSKFYAPVISGLLNESHRNYPFGERISKLLIGDRQQFSVWTATGDDEEKLLYLIYTFNAGDGDFSNQIWLCCISDNID